MVLFVNQLYAQEVLTKINDGSSWQNMAPRLNDGIGSNVILSLTGQELNITDGTNSSTIDLTGAAIADGTGTDDQTIDVFGRTSTTLNLSLEGDGQNTYSADLTPVIDSLMFRFTVTVDFPSIGNNFENDLTTATTLATEINEFPMMFGVPLNISEHHVKFAAYTDNNGLLHIICANYDGVALNLPEFDLNVTVLRGDY